MKLTYLIRFLTLPGTLEGIAGGAGPTRPGGAALSEGPACWQRRGRRVPTRPGALRSRGGRERARREPWDCRPVFHVTPGVRMNTAGASSLHRLPRGSPGE